MLFYLLESESLRRKSVTTLSARTNTDDTSVNSARDTVVKLDVELRNGIFYTEKMNMISPFPPFNYLPS